MKIEQKRPIVIHPNHFKEMAARLRGGRFRSVRDHFPPSLTPCLSDRGRLGPLHFDFFGKCGPV